MLDLLLCLPISFIFSLCGSLFLIPTFCCGLCAVGGGIGVLVSLFMITMGTAVVGTGIGLVIGGIILVITGVGLIPCFAWAIVGIWIIGVILGVGGLLVAGAGCVGIIPSLCVLVTCGIPALCSLICAIPLCLPLVSCCAIESVLSCGAVCLVGFSFPFWWVAMCPLTCCAGIPLYLGLSAPFCCVFPPCCISIPYLVHYGTHICCGVGICNLIDFWMLTVITLNYTIGEIISLGGWLCCPCCVCLPCLPFGISGLMLQTKLAYLCCSFPYTCWLEPFYLCAMLTLLSGWAVEILCVPFCMVCSLPLACLSTLGWIGLCGCQWLGCLGCGFSGLGGLGLSTCATGCCGLGGAYCCFCSSCLTCPSFSGLGLTLLGLAEKFLGFNLKGGLSALGCTSNVVGLTGCVNSCALDVVTPIVAFINTIIPGA